MRRRDFLERGALASAGLALPPRASAGEPAAGSCIFLHLTGGPSHLDTWDMKPDAPSHIRGPFRPIRTNAPGVAICEIFPRMARMADKFTIVRGVHHEASPMHETGMELIRAGLPAGLELWPDRQTDFAANCVKACKLIEGGERFVRVHMFGTVYGETTWDSHGYAPFSTTRDYRDSVGPAFDAAYTTLLTHLDSRGILATTLVIASGEFGRSPRINSAGGRDHWPHCWSVLVAGGGVCGGRVIGSSDATGSYPKDRPVSVHEITSVVSRYLSGDSNPRELFA